MERFKRATAALHVPLHALAVVLKTMPNQGFRRKWRDHVQSPQAMLRVLSSTDLYSKAQQGQCVCYGASQHCPFKTVASVRRLWRARFSAGLQMPHASRPLTPEHNIMRDDDLLKPTARH